MSAVLTERDLFEEFLEHGFVVSDSFTGAPLATLEPRGFLGDYEYEGDVCEGHFDIDRWLSQVRLEENPSAEIQSMLDQLAFFTEKLSRLHVIFEELKDTRANDRGLYNQRPDHWPGTSEFRGNVEA